jgi:hypothetical protein
MSKLNEVTKQKIKDQISKCLNGEAKTARAISMEINRSWNLTSRLLAELEQENHNVIAIKVGPIKAYAIKQTVPSLQETA